jgi:hypothetical protein
MSSASNPQIAVITHMEKKILESLSNREYMLVLRQLSMWINMLKTAHRPTKLMNEIKKEYTTLLSDTTESRAAYMNENIFRYMDWFGEVMQVLYTHDYLVDGGYDPTYPADLEPNNKYVSPLLQKSNP